MTHILIAGLKEPAGGVESAVLAYTEQFDPSEVATDFAFVCGKVSFEDRLHGQAFYLPNRIRHPLAYRRALKAIFANTAYDALWCNYSGLTNIDFLKEAKKRGVPVRIVHGHTAKYSWGNRIMKYLVPFFHTKNQKVIDRYATDLWACSAKSAQFMFGDRLATTATVIPNSVDTSQFTKDPAVRQALLAELGIPESAVVLGHVGRMCAEKNQRFLLDILRAAVKQDPRTVLLFIGDGELRDEVVPYADEIGVTDHVVFTGSRSDVAALLQTMDVFVLPSISEGFPVTVVEAQAADVPCVVSREAVVAEINISGNVHFLSLSDTPEEWAAKALAVVGSAVPGGAEKLAAAGYDSKTAAKALQNFFKGARK